MKIALPLVVTSVDPEFFFPPLAREYTPSAPPEVANLPTPSWFDSRGTPHTEQLHTIERWTRTNFGTMINDFPLDDPGALARPVQLKFTAKVLPPGNELMEFVCTENNQYGTAAGIPNIYKENGYGLERPVPPK